MQQRLQRASLGMVAVIWAATALKYSAIPDPVPIHWGAHAANGYLAKPWGALLVCFHAAFLNAVFTSVPLFPGRRNVSLETAARIQLGLSSLVLMVNAVILPLQAGEPRGGMPLLHTFLGLGILLVSLSVHTRATHAHLRGATRLALTFAGRTWFGLAFGVMLSGFFAQGMTVLGALLGVAVLLPSVYWWGVRRDQT